MRPLLATLAASFLIALPAQAQEFGVSPSDSPQTVLGAPSGREFFDAAVAIEKIEAVIVRVRNK